MNKKADIMSLGTALLGGTLVLTIVLTLFTSIGVGNNPDKLLEARAERTASRVATATTSNMYIPFNAPQKNKPTALSQDGKLLLDAWFEVAQRDPDDAKAQFGVDTEFFMFITDHNNVVQEFSGLAAIGQNFGHDSDEWSNGVTLGNFDEVQNLIVSKAKFLKTANAPISIKDKEIGYILNVWGYVDDTVIPPACNDGIDNDNDGGIDFGGDGDCDSLNDDSELGNLNKCADGIDNDLDGWIDMLDCGCSDPSDNNEQNLQVSPECCDGINNDYPTDNVKDWPRDGDCLYPSDPTESGGFVNTCCDGIDNGPDGFTDFPTDPDCGGCSDVEDDEANPVTECNDGIDNDKAYSIRVADFPNDCGCYANSDNTEALVDSICCPYTFEVDLQGGGTTNVLLFPMDFEESGCQYGGDEDNEDSSELCSNGVDDDNDGKTDWTEDPGCYGPYDNTENSPDDTSKECNNGANDDSDTGVDYGTSATNDQDCDYVLDDEKGEATDPLCGNGILDLAIPNPEACDPGSPGAPCPTIVLPNAGPVQGTCLSNYCTCGYPADWPGVDDPERKGGETTTSTSGHGRPAHCGDYGYSLAGEPGDSINCCSANNDCGDNGFCNTAKTCMVGLTCGTCEKLNFGTNDVGYGWFSFFGDGSEDVVRTGGTGGPMVDDVADHSSESDLATVFSPTGAQPTGSLIFSNPMTAQKTGLQMRFEIISQNNYNQPFQVQFQINGGGSGATDINPTGGFVGGTKYLFTMELDTLGVNANDNIETVILTAASDGSDQFFIDNFFIGD